MTVQLQSGDVTFTVADLFTISGLVADTWASAEDRDWSVRAPTVDWTCLATADHAVDCVYAPAFFLASRRVDAYPDVGINLVLGANATPARLVKSLQIATHLLALVVDSADPSVRAVIFRRPEILVGAPRDFAPRAAMELVLHAHDVCEGLGVPFTPPDDLCFRLREHTRPWPMWSIYWHGLGATDEPWRDLLDATGRA